jgi:hypothetical protein
VIFRSQSMVISVSRGARIHSCGTNKQGRSRCRRRS